MRKALPMALAICIPLILIIGTVELKTIAILTCVEFALFFTDFWFQLARWIDSTILDALYGWHSPHSNFNPLLGLNNAFGDLLMNFVLGMMFIVLPMFWIGALTWVGVHAGSVMQGLTTGAHGAREAGSQGGGALIKAAQPTRGAKQRRLIAAN
jgi:hypothetical protein